MAEISKQALKVENNQSFPNNNNGAITPAILRDFNIDMIDSLVDELGYNVDSASWNQQIDALEQFTASLATAFVSTASFNSFTSSINAYTASNNTKWNNVEVATASLFTSVNNLNTTTASLVVETQNLELFSASALTSLSNLNSATSSLFTSASLGLTTASLSGQTLTFSKGDGTTFGILIPDVSGSDISQLNAFTASQEILNTTFATTGSNSFIGNQIITGNVTISGSATSDLTVVGQIFVSSSATALATAPKITVSGSAGQSIINRNSIRTSNTTDTAALFPSTVFLADLATLDEIGVTVDPVAFSVSGWTTGPAIYVNNTAGDTYPAVLGFQNKANYTDGRVAVLTPLSASAGFTASLQNGYAWVGNSLGQNTQVATSSFGTAINTGSFVTTASFNEYTSSQSTGSLLQTASVNVNVLTFTKADGSTFDLTVTASGSVVEGTISSSAQITALGFVSSSVTASSLVTASFDNGTRNLTFTKGDSSTFNINIPDVSGSTGNFATTGSNTFNGDQTINGNVNITGSFTASGLIYPTADNGANSFIQTDGAGNLSLQYVESVYETIRNSEAITIPKGTPVYISGSTGDNGNAYVADASDLLKMPAVYIAGEDLTAGQTGLALLSGKIEGVDTSAFIPGTIVYVGEGGGYTSNRPSGSNSVVQVLGVVSKQGVGGQGVIINQLEAVLPNIQTGYVWVGNGTNQPIAVATSSFIEDLSGYVTTASFNSYTASQSTASLVTSITELNGFSASTLTRLTNIESTTASLLIETENLEQFSASALISLSNLNTSTASLFTSTSLNLKTASVNLNTITFTKGDNSTFSLTVDTGSGGGGAAFPYVGDAQISGSLGVTGSMSGFVNTLTISSNTASMDFNNGNFFTLQLVSGSITHLTATNIRPGQTINLLVKTDSGSPAASGSLTFSPTFKFAGGFDYTPTAITASQDLVSFVTFDTTQILAAQVKNLS